MNTQILLPTEFTDKLAITAEQLTSPEICRLSETFTVWLKDAFEVEEITFLVAARAQFVDRVLAKLWCQHQLDEYQISLIAVGGYGRNELHPHSDVDILLLTQIGRAHV